MSDVGVGALLIRMIVSLAVGLGLVFAAYAILRRRNTFSSGGAGNGRATKSGRRPSSLVRSKSGTAGSRGKGLSVVGRIGIGRTVSVVAVQFGNRVFMLGASEQGAPSLLAELDLEQWNQATQLPEDLAPIRHSGSGAPEASSKRVGFLDALRESTTRRG